MVVNYEDKIKYFYFLGWGEQLKKLYFGYLLDLDIRKSNLNNEGIF